jgi:hypothetical protein
MMIRVGAVTVAAIALAGCESSNHRSASTVTVPAYGVFPERTVSSSSAPPSEHVCEEDARAFTRGATQFLAHYGPQAAYPADLYYVILREAYSDFAARRCEPELLGAALRRRLTARQRSTLVDLLPSTMAAAVRRALARAGS